MPDYVFKRANINVAIIEKSTGGKLNNIFNIENYPGFPTIEGSILSQNMYKQIMKTVLLTDMEMFRNKRFRVIK